MNEQEWLQAQQQSFETLAEQVIARVDRIRGAAVSREAVSMVLESLSHVLAGLATDVAQAEFEIWA